MIEIPSKELQDKMQKGEMVCEYCNKQICAKGWYSVHVKNFEVHVMHEECFKKYLEDCYNKKLRKRIN